jgi:hypothetical protein
MATATQTAPEETSQQKTSAPETKLQPKGPADPSDMTQQEHDPHKIAQLAYSYWEARGCPQGSAEEDWFRAEQKIYGDTSMTEG